MRKCLYQVAFLAIIFAISLFLHGCITTRPATDAVIRPDNLASQMCKPLQQKYYNDFLVLSKKMPFNMQVNTMGFLEWKGDVYFSINLVGKHYNTITTTATSRLTNEFNEKYQIVNRLFLNESFIGDVAGVHLTLICSSTNFVSDKYGLYSKEESLEVFSKTSVIQQFINGDITAQDLIDQSIVFINAQRTKFTLQML